MAEQQRGYIIPVGGAEEKIGDVTILRRFAALCGGPACRIAIIPTASELSDTGARYEDAVPELGVDMARVAAHREPGDCERPELAGRAGRSATGSSSPAATSSGSAP